MSVTFVGSSSLAGAVSAGYLPSPPTGAISGDYLIYAIEVGVSHLSPLPQSDLFSGLTRSYADGYGFAVYTGIYNPALPPTFNYVTAPFALSQGAWRGATSFASVTGAASLTAPAATSTTPGVAVRAYGGQFAAHPTGDYFTMPTGVTVRAYASDGSGTPYTGADLADASAPAGVAVPTATATAGTTSNPASATIVLAGNHPPNAPTLNTPATSATLDRTTSNRFAWTFSDPDAGDHQSAFDLTYSADSGSTWTTFSGTTTDNFVDVAGGTFAAGSYEWKVRTYDALGVVGPYSTVNFFTSASPTGVPTITSPTDGGTVGTSPWTVTWTVGTQTAYEVRTVADVSGTANPTTIYFDTGNVTDSVSRSVPVPFAVNGQVEHVQVRIQAGGLWSAWADVRITVMYEVPWPALLVLEQVATTLAVTITNTPASGNFVDAVSNDVYYSANGSPSVRVAKGLPINTYWVYPVPASGDVTIQVVATASSGATSVSA